MVGPRHALTLRSKGQMSNFNPNSRLRPCWLNWQIVRVIIVAVCSLHICYLYISTLRSRSQRTTSQSYQVATCAVKTYIRPAWVCMSIRLHISLVLYGYIFSSDVTCVQACPCFSCDACICRAQINVDLLTYLLTYLLIIFLSTYIISSIL